MLRAALLLIVFAPSLAFAQSALDDSAAAADGVAKGEASSGAAGRSSGRVIEFSGGGQGGVVEATPHISTAEELAAEKNDDGSSDGKKNVPSTKREQQNSVKLITGGDPTEGSAKVGRLPVLD